MTSLLFLLAASLLQAETSVAAQAAGIGEAAAPARQQAEALLAADRAFAASSAGKDSASAIAAMFGDDVIMPLPDGRFARGRAEAEAALRANPFNLASSAEWTPIRAGISAGGQHGFTFGYMTMTGEDGSRRLLKYLAYWVQGPEGWRVAAYRRVPRPDGEASFAVMTPSLPARPGAADADPATAEAHRHSLIAAEQAFSNAAQEIGLGPAFLRNGHEEAVNLGAGPGFVHGPAAIAEMVGGDSPTSPVNWNADHALVSPAGDLGITFGLIRPNSPPVEGRPSAMPFFTIWRRDSPDGRWLYIAE